MENVKEIVKIGQKLTAHKGECIGTKIYVYQQLSGFDSPDDMQLAADYLAYTLCHVR